MKFKLYLIHILYLFSSIGANADEKKTFYIKVHPELSQTKKFSNSNVEVSELKFFKNGMPLKTIRNSIFNKISGLNGIVYDWDELDKDLLFVRAQSKTLSELQKIYPAISKSVLTSLQSEIRDSK